MQKTDQKEVFTFNNYVDKRRWASYYIQIWEIVELRPKTVLVIGVGDHIVVNILKSQGIEVFTLDLDDSLGCDYAMDITEIDKLNAKFDAILCCQVLEHLPFRKFITTIGKIMNCTSTLVLSLPIQHLSYFSFLKIQRLLFKRIIFSVPKFYKTYQYNGDHYWELGTKGFSKSTIKSLINENNFVSKEFTLAENSYHHFFIVKKLPNETKNEN